MPATRQLDRTEFARCFDSNVISPFAPFHWLALAFKDMARAPILSLIYGLLFSIIPAVIMWFVINSGSPHVILPAAVAFALIGPSFAAGLYDVAWELEKGHTPTFSHSLKSMFRNPAGEWGFAILLLVLMIVWMRLAALIYALYPNSPNPTLEELSAFLTLGSIVGGILLVSVFAISAFTPQIMLERRVDIMTAVVTSMNAVRKNVPAMIVWCATISVLVVVGFLTGAAGFIVIMPLLAYASWHGYIAVVKTKKPRHYE
ncbi:Putative cytochrome c oxidase, subunit I [Pseudoalteromonas luteoviolacea B = ATCC 29581]|nr:Putative cytochrome c oxidase, subunit I [Pseudoalteromonas luteoviolacea B = ATCC 29581]